MHTVLLEIRSSVAYITLNRPHRGNAIDLVMAQSLLDTASQCRERSVRAVVLRGAGKHFCVGGDIRIAELEDDAMQAHVLELTDTLHAAISAFTRLEAPVIAAARGAVAGAGVGLVCMADLAVAARSCFFSPAFTAVAMTPDSGTTYLLPRIVGQRRALELLLTNRHLSAAEALDWGLVTQLVADGELNAAAAFTAQQLADGPLHAYGVTKRLVGTAMDDFESHLTREAQAIAQQRISAEGKEGIRAFCEKRAPVYVVAPARASNVFDYDLKSLV